MRRSGPCLHSLTLCSPYSIFHENFLFENNCALLCLVRTWDDDRLIWTAARCDALQADRFQAAISKPTSTSSSAAAARPHLVSCSSPTMEAMVIGDHDSILANAQEAYADSKAPESLSIGETGIPYSLQSSGLCVPSWWRWLAVREACNIGRYFCIYV